MSEKLSFAELKKVAANQATTIRNENQILANQRQELAIKKAQLEMEVDRFEEAKNAELKHLVLQCSDFAIRTLPFWNRSPRRVVDRATEFLLMLKRETAKHVAMDVLTQKVQEEGIDKVKAETEKVLDGIIGQVETVSMDKDGKIVAIHATTPDRETAEMETV